MATRVIQQPAAGLRLSSRQLGGVAGILTLVLMIAGSVLIGEMPNIDDPVNDVRSWFDDNGSNVLAGFYVTSLGLTLFFIPFLAALYSTLAASEEAPRIWSRVAAIGGALFVVFGLTSFAFTGALAAGIDQLDSDAAVRTLQYLDYYAQSTNALAFAPFALGVSVAVLRTGAFWRWTGWLGLFVALLSVAGGASAIDGESDGLMQSIALVALPFEGVWLVALSAGLLLKRATPA